ncbi:hypothetical protein HaLaN_03809 [Haematococcus lacustris]|uniref:Uncharacterized protein n=1 Tax=Haematococcus lacustris TaxID=44745 RepID=A0A699YHV0_HAELA|nr:hypothetical protein HaLaN_03809 [Haematococcus lacustris]
MGEGKRSAVTHRNNTGGRPGTGWSRDADKSLDTKEFMALMYPQGEDKAQATCVQVMENGQLCGQRGTVNRLKSESKSFKEADGQGQAWGLHGHCGAGAGAGGGGGCADDCTARRKA